MRLEEDYTRIVHQVERAIEGWLRGQAYDRKRVNTEAVCDVARVGILYHEDGVVTCITCVGRMARR